MAIAVPVGISDRLVGTGFIAGIQGHTVAVVTALHLLGNGQDFRIGLPPHRGDLAVPQKYPLLNMAALRAHLAIAEPLLDIAILLVTEGGLQAPVPRYISTPSEVAVGDDVLIIGYPFAVMGSFLETVEPCSISAIGNRLLANNATRYEFILAHQTHSGSSGSPVVRKSDGTVCGIIRGCLAPPGVLSIGNMPIGTDTNVTYATSAHVIPTLISEAFATGVLDEQAI